MASFTDSALEKKLAELNGSQQSIQTLSLWLIHHRKHHKSIVQVWYKELRKAKPNRKLTFMYLANDVIQNSKKKGPEFSKEFSTVLGRAFSHVRSTVTDDKTKNGLDRIINVWEDRNVYDKTIIAELRDAMLERKSTKRAISSQEKSDKKDKSEKRVKSFGKLEKAKDTISEKLKTSNKLEKAKDKNTAKRIKSFDIEPIIKKKKSSEKDDMDISAKSPPGDPPDAEELIKALQDLENSPSTDAVVREKIASLPPEVSDITLLEKIQSREAAEKLSKQVDEACAILTDYNSRLSDELEDRKQVSKMLSDFTHAQREQLALAERKMEEYRGKLKRVTQVRNELKSHLQNLPDLTLLPSVTAGLAPLPSAGDLFN